MLSPDEAVVVGRATENAISIPDTSVSRRHCTVRRGRAGFVIADLGSGNGTLVNGERIEEETALGHGDVITIGDTELTFADVENATDRRPQPSRRPASEASLAPRRAGPARGRAPADPARNRKTMFTVAMVVAVLLGGLFGAKAWVNKRNAARALIAQQQQKVDLELSALFQEGKSLVRDGKWVDAKVKFEALVERAPQYPGVQDYLNRTNVEIPNQEHLLAAEKALSENRIAAASAALEKVSRDTQQFEKLRQLNAKVSARVSQRLEEAVALLNTAGEKDVRRAAYVQAQEITSDILQVSAEHRDAQVVHENATRAIAQVDYVAPTAPPPPPRPWSPAVDRFKDGDMTGALSIADACASKDRRCRELAKDIREFANLYKNVEELDSRGLSRLLAVDKSITGGSPSKAAQLAGRRAANIFYKSASSAKAAGQWGRSIEWGEKALKADPTHQGARAIVDEVRGRAKDEYLRCYQLKDQSPDDAVSCFRGVLQMCTPGDETYEKTKGWIAKLDAR